jgi:hypothetical protein
LSGEANEMDPVVATLRGLVERADNSCAKEPREAPRAPAGRFVARPGCHHC